MANSTAVLNNTGLANDFASVDYANFSLDYENGTSSFEPIDFNALVKGYREFYIEEVFGQHHQLIFHVTLVMCIIGYITNIFNVVVLAWIPMAHSMNLFLLVLSVADMCHISTQFSHIIHYFSGFQLFPYYPWVVFFIVNTYFETMFLYATNWLVVAIGVWRFVAITWPLQSRDWCSRGRAKKVIVIIFILSAVLAAPVFAVLTYRSDVYESVVFYDKDFSELALRNNGAFHKFYWFLILFNCFIPSIILAVLTIALFKSLWKARTIRSSISATKKQSPFIGSHRTTIMLTILLVLYVLSNFPDGCMVFLALVTNGDGKLQAEYMHTTNIIRVFLLGNNCLSFFIYYGLGEGFRTRFHRIFCRCFVKKTVPNRNGNGGTMASDSTQSRSSTVSFYSSEPVLDNPNIYVNTSNSVTVL